jgi:hypothetical protein
MCLSGLILGPAPAVDEQDVLKFIVVEPEKTQPAPIQTIGVCACIDNRLPRRVERVSEQHGLIAACTAFGRLDVDDFLHVLYGHPVPLVIKGGGVMGRWILLMIDFDVTMAWLQLSEFIEKVDLVSFCVLLRTEKENTDLFFPSMMWSKVSVTWNITPGIGNECRRGAAESQHEETGDQKTCHEMGILYFVHKK